MDRWKRDMRFYNHIKTRTGSFLDEKRMQIFAGLLESEELSWYQGTAFSSCKELEEEFI